jgi:PAS domain S-box-containing protein
MSEEAAAPVCGMRAPAGRARDASRARHDYRALFHAVDDGFCIIEVLFDALGHAADYRFLEVNPAFVRHTGLDAAVGRRMRELAPAHEQHWFDIYGSVALNGEPVRFVHHASALGARWFDVQAHRFGEPSAHQVAILFRDISERVLAEMALLESETRLRHITNASPAILWTSDAAGRCVFTSERWREFSGQPAHSGWGASDEQIHPEDRARIREAWVHAVAHGLPYDVQARLRRHDGAWRWFVVRATPQRDGAGRVVAWHGSSMDIHDHKRAEHALRLSEQRMALAMEVAQLGTWVWDQGSGQVEANARFREMCGLEADGPLDLAGVATHIHPEDWPRVQAGLEAALQVDGNGNFAEEFRWVHADGSVRWTQSRGQVLFADVDGEQRPVRLTGSAVDVTERHRTEDALREASRRKDEFLATLAHELRNPLAPLRNCLHLLRAEGADRERLQAVMERQVAQLGRLVDDLMEVSRITRGNVPLQLAAVVLDEVVQRAVETSQPLIDAAGHRLRIELPSPPLVLQADAVRVAQVLANLLNNAAKYTEPGGEITLRARREEGAVVLEVRDTGIGIAPGQLSRVFDLFTQVDGGLARAQGGLGIGLTLVRSLVELHGGSVQACSDGIGCGSVFVVRLPLRRQHAGAPVPATPAVAADAGPCRLLVVDDNRDHADTLALFLRMAGHEVRVAHDGYDGVAAAQEFAPDVVLLDLGMPRLDGYEACRRMRAQPDGQARVMVALTGWGQDEDRRRSHEAGFDAHLVKPADPVALLELVLSLLRAKAQR